MGVGIGLIISLIVAITTAFFADQRGRDAVAWYFIGLIFSWMGLIALYCIKPLEENHPA